MDCRLYSFNGLHILNKGWSNDFGKKPWLKFYKNVPETIDYPRVTMYEAFMETVKKIK